MAVSIFAAAAGTVVACASAAATVAKAETARAIHATHREPHTSDEGCQLTGFRARATATATATSNSNSSNNSSSNSSSSRSIAQKSKPCPTKAPTYNMQTKLASIAQTQKNNNGCWQSEQFVHVFRLVH